MRICSHRASRRNASVLSFLLFAAFLLPASFLPANTYAQSEVKPATTAADEIFRLERVPVDGGAELITIHARLDGIEAPQAGEWVPLVTVLRDTLGDLNAENDRLRYVWPLTYTRPTLKQRLSGAVPFLYSRVGNKNRTSEKAPPPVLDLAAADRDVWNKIFWTALQSLLLDPYGMPIKASTRSYRAQHFATIASRTSFARSRCFRCIRRLKGPPAFSESELSEIQARLQTD